MDMISGSEKGRQSRAPAARISGAHSVILLPEGIIEKKS
ncbi:hypothetical protein AYI68_g7755, partial [Smittium mucronatum]